ncbi:MAG: hypothetical protein ACTHMY_07290 [Solirubrobacteraceae bacterium]
MATRVREFLNYKTQTPWLTLMQFSGPVFVVVLVVALLLGAAAFWAAFVAGLLAIATQLVVDRVWRRRHTSGAAQGQ